MHAPDAARLAARRGRATTSRATGPDVAHLRVRHGLPPPREGRQGRSRRTSTTRSACSCRRLAPRSWRGASAPRPTSSPRRALLGGLAGALRRALVASSSEQRPFLHPGRSAAVLAGRGGQPISWASRRAAPAGGGRVGSRADRRLRDRPRQACGGEREVNAFDDRSVPSRRCARTSPSTLPTSRSPRARSCTPCAGPAGELLEDAEIFDVYSGRAGGGGAALARAGALLPLARADADRRGRRPAAREDRRGAGSAGRRAAWLASPALRAGLAAGSRRRRDRLRRRAGGAAALASPRLRADRVTARSEAGAGLQELYPRYRVPLTLEELDPAAHAGLDAAIVAYPHAAAAPTVGCCSSAGARVVDLSADFRLSSLETYERWYGPHPRPELLVQAAYGLTELHREAIAGACDRGQPRLLPDGHRAGARAAGAGRPDRRRRRRRQAGHLGRRPGLHEQTHLSMAGENIASLQGGGPPAHAGDRGAARLLDPSKPVRLQFQASPGAVRPG